MISSKSGLKNFWSAHLAISHSLCNCRHLTLVIGQRTPQFSKVLLIKRYLHLLHSQELHCYRLKGKSWRSLKASIQLNSILVIFQVALIIKNILHNMSGPKVPQTIHNNFKDIQQYKWKDTLDLVAAKSNTIMIYPEKVHLNLAQYHHIQV